MKTIFFLFFACSLRAMSIVFIHIGPSPLPDHLGVAIAQARYFNPDCPIYVVAHLAALKNRPYANSQVTLVSCESLPISEAHQKFRNCRTHLDTAGGFWIWTSERFFYLDELIRSRQLNDVFHLENDVMLYMDLTKTLPIFQKRYAGMLGGIFEKDDRCVPGLLYISNPIAMEMLANFMPVEIQEGTTDMITLARFKDAYQGIWIDFLPIMIPEYVQNGDPALWKNKTTTPENYVRYFEDFQSVFDGAAFGIYLAGWNAKFHAECHPGEISPLCIFNASHFPIEWALDEEGRRVPFFKYEDRKIRINNLHITNKGMMPQFSSR
jgi:hypothetical protein